MEKVEFIFDANNEKVEFFVLEQTNVGGYSYLLVTETEEGDSECLILKKKEQEMGCEDIYDIVEDEAELKAVSKVFEELLDDIHIEM